MSRGLSATNITAITSASVEPVLLAKLGFSTPVYTHSGIGTITYDGNSYVGVGNLGNVTAARESELLGPVAVTLTLSGIDSAFMTEALNSGSHGDAITIYEGYRNTDGTLLDDPWIVWQGTLEYSQLTRGESNTISLVCQHDLAVLEEKDGGRFTDEDQQNKYSGDLAFEFVHDQAGKKLFWGGGPVSTGRKYPGYKDEFRER